MRIWIVLAAAVLMTGCSGEAHQASVNQRYCQESKDAAHYMASLGNTPYEVTRIADLLIADRKYPALGDKGTAATAMFVAQAQRAGMSPEDIVREVGKLGVCAR